MEKGEVEMFFCVNCSSSWQNWNSKIKKRLKIKEEKMCLWKHMEHKSRNDSNKKKVKKKSNVDNG